ncbi:MAG: tetratricopeptide repeat protein [Armatimonas sp.]
MDEEAPYQLDERLERARHLINLGRAEQAVPLVADVLRDDPDDGEALGVMACALFCSGDYLQARRTAEQATAASPFDEYPHRLLSFILLGIGQKKEALAAAQEAVRLDPESSGALWALFQALQATRQRKEALEVAETLVELFPEEEDSHLARSEGFLGLRNWGGAEQAARDGLAVRPDYPALHIALARALWPQRRRPESLLAYRDAVLADPGQSQAAEALSEQVGGYIIPIERALPWYLWMCFTSFLCWYAHRVVGMWTWWGLLWSVLLLAWNSIYLMDTDLWILRRTYSRYVEIPVEVQRHLWLAKAFSPNISVLLSVIGFGLITILLLVVWTVVPKWSPAVVEGWGFVAGVYLFGLGVSALGAIGKLGSASDDVVALKPVEPREENYIAVEAPKPDWLRHSRPGSIPYDLYDTPEYDLDEL